MKTNFEKADSLINSFFNNFDGTVLKGAFSINRIWHEIVSEIKGPYLEESSRRMDYGSQLSDHSFVKDLKNGTLIVETDHPARIQLFQNYKDFIKKGLNSRIKDIEIKNIIFRLKRETKETTDYRLPTSDEIERVIERTESKNIDHKTSSANPPVKTSLSSQSAPDSKPPVPENSTLPPEVTAIFDRIRKNM